MNQFLKNTKEGLKEYKNTFVAIGILFLLSGSAILAQGLGYFPRYPYRIDAVVKELNLAGLDLAYLNQELENFAEQCSCKNAQSQCGQVIGADYAVREIELNPKNFNLESMTPETAANRAGSEINRLKNHIDNSIKGLNAFVLASEQKTSFAPQTYGNIVGGDNPEQDGQQYLQETKSNIKLTASEINQVKNKIAKLKELDGLLNQEKNSLDTLKQELLKNKDALNPEELKSHAEIILNEIRNKIDQQILKIPDFPKQLENKLENMAEDLKNRIATLPDTIKSALFSGGCDPGGLEVFGETCLDKKLIEKTQYQAKDKIDQISYLRDLLKKEMESGLEAELKTLREDEAATLREGLAVLMDSSEELSKAAKANIDILSDKKYATPNQCSANCGKEISGGLQACILDNAGEQGDIKLLFEVGVRLQDLDLGEINIQGAGLDLPEKLSVGKITNFGDFNIPMPDAVIKWPDIQTKEKPFGIDPITIYPPIPSLPQIPLGNFACIKTGGQTYSCQQKDTESKDNNYLNLEWYLNTFSWLSEKCQELPGSKGSNGLPDESRLAKCINKDIVHEEIINVCDKIWQDYIACSAMPFVTCKTPSGICADIKYEGERNTAASQKCRDLFNQMGETVPPKCDSAELENKCGQIRREGGMEMPDQCFYVPLFTGNFKNPEPQTFKGNLSYCPSQNISDVPATSIRLDCPLSESYAQSITPKLNLPDIIIPDIKLPSFSFMPFFKVKLPNLIFEDLIFSNYNFCDFDDCLDIIPALQLDIPYPALKIPPIKIPPIKTSVPIGGDIGDIPLDIDTEVLEFPPMPIPFPEFDLAKFISLDLDMPKIDLPVPEIVLNFKGIEMDSFNFLLGLVSSIIDIPTGCIGGGISGIPIIISYPDYYFYWPRFLKNIDLCNNEYVSINKFCKDVKESVYSELNPKIAKIQNAINKAIQKNIQDHLDDAAKAFAKIVEDEIYEGVKKAELKIKENAKREIEKMIKEKKEGDNEEGERQKKQCEQWCEEDCENEGENRPIFESLCKKDCNPSGSIPLEDINIPAEKFEGVNMLLKKIPAEIPINWPEEVKNFILKKPIKEKLGVIPLEELSYVRDKEIPLPGLQKSSLEFSITGLNNYPACESLPPSGGNPYPMETIRVNLGEILNLSRRIDNTAREINDILQ